MQQTLTNLTRQAILELEQQGWRFELIERSKRTKLKKIPGIKNRETLKKKCQIEDDEACEYLTERAKSYIRECRQLIGVIKCQEHQKRD